MVLKDQPKSQRNHKHMFESLNVVLSDIDYVINNIDHNITSSLLYTMSIVLWQTDYMFKYQVYY